MSGHVIIANPRDAREFVEAKRRKREPIHWHAQGVTEACCKPRTLADFTALRAGLRGAPDFGHASERLDSLEVALFRRHMVKLPNPRKVMQNSDRSLTIWWGNGIMVRAFTDKFFSLLGGAKGIPAPTITTDLLDALAAHQRIVQ
jgi:hypothetical protein